MTQNGLIIAAPASNSGKTFVTLGLLRALRRNGVKVASAKVGPDYIDPAFHAAATGKLCPNLDGWAMRDETYGHLIKRQFDDADLMVCEGVMGLFDGATLPADCPHTRDGSPADLARRTGWPVVLVIDASAQATSAAALIHGFASFDANVHVTGVIFNKVGGEGHIKLLENACQRYIPDIKILGYIPRQQDLALPERHLGLVLADEHPDLETFLDTAADHMARHLDLDQIPNLARPAQLATQNTTAQQGFFAPLGQRIAIAKDRAFAFAYPALLRNWQERGAELSFFSPLANEAPDQNCDAVYLPGGYPELHVDQLAANTTFLTGLRDAHHAQKVIFGECGGYMTLGKTLTDKQGRVHKMAGLLDLDTSFAKRKLHLGYRDCTLLHDTPFGAKGTRLHAHEFHYASITHENGPRLFQTRNATGVDMGEMGLVNGRCFASFIHLLDHTD